MDEGHPVCPVLDLLGDIDHGPADVASTERRGREQQHDRLPAERLGEVNPVHVVRGVPGIDPREVAVDVGDGWGMDRRRGTAHGRDVRRAAHLDGGGNGRGAVRVVLAEQGDHAPGAVVREVNVGDVEELRGIGVALRRPRLEPGSHAKALEPRRKRPQGFAALGRRRVEGDGRIWNLLAANGEDPEPEPVVTPLIDRCRRADDQVRSLSIG
jgi:hypothetical protein